MGRIVKKSAVFSEKRLTKEGFYGRIEAVFFDFARGRCDYDEVIILHRTDRLGRIALAIVPLHIIQGGDVHEKGIKVVLHDEAC